MKRKQKTKIVNRLLLGGIPLLLLLFFTTTPKNSKAQQVTPAVICSAGETFTSNGLSLDFTVGEIMTESLTTTGLLLTQGFQQGPDRSTGIEENMVKEKDVLIYPNPVQNRVYLLFQDPRTRLVRAVIKDLRGRTILGTESGSNLMYLNLEKLSPGFYTVSILFENHQIVNKKVIKQ